MKANGLFRALNESSTRKRKPVREKKVRCSCGTFNASESKFCFSCGESLVKLKNECTACGSSLHENSNYCEFCGVALNPVLEQEDPDIEDEEGEDLEDLEDLEDVEIEITVEDEDDYFDGEEEDPDDEEEEDPDDEEEEVVETLNILPYNEDTVKLMGKMLESAKAPKPIMLAYEKKLFNRCAAWLEKKKNIKIDLTEGFTKKETAQIKRYLESLKAPKYILEAFDRGQNSLVSSFIKNKGR